MVSESEFAGKWRVIEAVDMADDYLSLSPDPTSSDKCGRKKRGDWKL